MKKILIILSLILSCNIANAAGVSCWEEYATTNKTEPATSALRTALINAGITPILTSKIYELTIHTEQNTYYDTAMAPTYHTSRIPLELVDLTEHDDKTGIYVPYYYYYYRYYSGNNTSKGSTDGYFYLGNRGDIRTIGYTIYTYCIVDNSSSGGGGGTILSAPVVFLIKATS